MRSATLAFFLFLLAAPPADGQVGGGHAEASWFVDRAESLGVDFVHRSGARGHFYMPEIFGSGAALFDADGDGDLDLYAVDAGDHGQVTVGLPGEPPAALREPRPGRNRLWRQEADGTFTDISATSGLDHDGYGMGVAIGDVDADGLDDVFITNVGADALLRNRGDGSFEDVTAAFGLAATAETAAGTPPPWSASALFFDHDDDGDLDLFVVHYLGYRPALACSDQLGRPDYCGPGAFAPTTDRLYRNDGGHFRDITREAGLEVARGKGLGVVAADFDGDGRLDLYVANDGEANRLWLQEAPGRFQDRAVELGVAVDAAGRPEAGMGVALGDADGDGRLDLFVSHLRAETNTFYRAEAGIGFADRTVASGLAAPSLPFTGFGTAFADLDLDGDLDLVVANGGVTRGPGSSDDGYAQHSLLFTNDGSGRFERRKAGALTDTPAVGRAVVSGDIDDDGDLDLVLSSGDGRLRLYQNQLAAQADRHWLQVTVRGPGGGMAEQARVTVVTASGRQVRHVHRAQGYLSSHDPRLSFGLGDGERVASLEVVWRGGRTRRFLDLPADRRVVVVP